MSTATMGTPARSLREDVTVISVIGVAHAASHFSQLLLAPLFPWLKEAFNVGYTELGLLLTLFFVTSCIVQTSSGFIVDRYGPRPVLYAGLALTGLSALGFAASQQYWMLAASAVVAGMGNGVFHPVDYTLLNRKVSAPRLAHGYSVHGITGSLGWALAPVLTVPIAMHASWRLALVVAAGVIFAALAVVVMLRRHLGMAHVAPAPAARQAVPDSTFGFLRIPAVWVCFGFFMLFAGALTAIQAFAPEATRQLHGVAPALSAACITLYMVCSASGMVLGGFLAKDPARCERIVGIGFAIGAGISVLLALGTLAPWMVPALFGLMGFVTGSAGPSRDMIVKRSTPDNASGRVYGVVYSGLDIGQAVAPLFFAPLMDLHRYSAVVLGLALIQAVLIVTALNVRKVRRTHLVPA